MITKLSSDAFRPARRGSLQWMFHSVFWWIGSGSGNTPCIPASLTICDLNSSFKHTLSKDETPHPSQGKSRENNDLSSIVRFPSGCPAPVVLEPADRALDCPAALVTTKLAAVLGLVLGLRVQAVWGDHVHSECHQPGCVFVFPTMSIVGVLDLRHGG